METANYANWFWKGHILRIDSDPSLCNFALIFYALFKLPHLNPTKHREGGGGGKTTLTGFRSNFPWEILHVQTQVLFLATTARVSPNTAPPNFKFFLVWRGKRVLRTSRFGQKRSTSGGSGETVRNKPQISIYHTIMYNIIQYNTVQFSKTNALLCLSGRT